jgi:hypothetical protein
MRERRRWRRAAAAVVAIATCVLLAGCSSGVAQHAVPSASASASSSDGSAPRYSPSSQTAPAQLRIEMASWRLPEALSRASAFAVGSDIELAGGLTARGSSTSTVSLLDPSTGRARTVAGLPIAVHDAAGAQLGSDRVIFGGGASGSDATVQRLRVGVPGAVIGSLPSPRSDLVAASIGDATYLLGGYDGATWSASVLKTTDGATFTTAATLPVPVRYPAIAVTKQVIWLFGGLTAAGPTAVIQRIDTATGQARVAGRLHAPLTDAAGLLLDGQVLVCGGIESGRASDRVERFDPITDTVTPAGRLPTPLHDAAGVVVAGVGYLLGGEDPAVTSGVVVLSASGTQR